MFSTSSWHLAYGVVRQKSNTDAPAGCHKDHRKVLRHLTCSTCCCCCGSSADEVKGYMQGHRGQGKQSDNHKCRKESQCLKPVQQWHDPHGRPRMQYFSVLAHGDTYGKARSTMAGNAGVCGLFSNIDTVLQDFCINCCLLKIAGKVLKHTCTAC